jgi:hypothetical protein
MKIVHLFFIALLCAAPASQLSAHTASLTSPQAEEILTDTSAYAVLEAAAPLLGESVTHLNNCYRTGSLTITDLGLTRAGRRYQVVYEQHTGIIVELILNG